MKNTKEPAAIKRYIEIKHNQINISLALSALTLMLLGMSRPAGAETLYSLNDLGPISEVGADNLHINNSGQVIGTSVSAMNSFRTAPNSPINQETDDLGNLGGGNSYARGINKSGQVVGDSGTASREFHAFRTAPNSLINPETDDLGTLGGGNSYARGINKSGQVVGDSGTASGEFHAFRTAPNSPINPETDDLGTLGGRSVTVGGDISSSANDINESGQVVGFSRTAGTPQVPARVSASNFV